MLYPRSSTVKVSSMNDLGMAQFVTVWYSLVKPDSMFGTRYSSQFGFLTTDTPTEEKF